MKNPVASCLAFAAALENALPSLQMTAKDTGNALDFLTREHTAFGYFSELVNAKGGYGPSLHKAPEHFHLKAEVVHMPSGRKITAEMRYAELDCLAIAYDIAQEARGDSRRAFRS